MLNTVTVKRAWAITLVVLTLIWLGPPVFQALDALITIVLRSMVIVGLFLTTRYHKEIAHWAKTTGKESLKELF
jgi:hypothetical protein